MIDLQERRNKILKRFCFGRNRQQILILEVFRDDRWRLQWKCPSYGMIAGDQILEIDCRNSLEERRGSCRRKELERGALPSLGNNLWRVYPLIFRENSEQRPALLHLMRPKLQTRFACVARCSILACVYREELEWKERNMLLPSRKMFGHTQVDCLA